jgi:hypothetical protein
MLSEETNPRSPQQSLPKTIRPNHPLSGKVETITTPALGIESKHQNAEKQQSYGIAFAKIQNLRDTQQTAGSTENEQYLLGVVSRLQSDLEKVKSQSTQLI